MRRARRGAASDNQKRLEAALEAGKAKGVSQSLSEQIADQSYDFIPPSLPPPPPSPPDDVVEEPRDVKWRKSVVRPTAKLKATPTIEPAAEPAAEPETKPERAAGSAAKPKSTSPPPPNSSSSSDASPQKRTSSRRKSLVVYKGASTDYWKHFLYDRLRAACTMRLLRYLARTTFMIRIPIPSYTNVGILYQRTSPSLPRPLALNPQSRACQQRCGRGTSSSRSSPMPPATPTVATRPISSASRCVTTWCKSTVQQNGRY